MSTFILMVLVYYTGDYYEYELARYETIEECNQAALEERKLNSRIHQAWCVES